MGTIVYMLNVNNRRTHEKIIWRIEVNASSKWATPSAVLASFFRDHPEYDDNDCHIAIHNIEEADN